MSWKSSGFIEQGLGTATPDLWLDLFLGSGAWTCLWEGPATAIPLWPSDAPRPDHEWLLARPGTDTGAVRLYHFGAGVDVARADAQPWDTGGFFDIDLRVQSIDEWTERLVAPAWRGLSAPVDWTLGNLQVREWLVRGPDDVILALIERLDPPLEPPASAGLSHAFNATQTVKNMAVSLDFYKALGFDVLERQSGPLDGGGGRVLGLSGEAANTTPVELAMLSTDTQLNGSIELIGFPTLSGRQWAVDHGPGLRGLNLMRIPVRGVESLALDLQCQNIPVQGMARWECPPYGVVRGLAICTPEGAWLELLETEQEAM